MKKKFVRVMFFGALALSSVTYVGCKDYDDDIDNLQQQIDAVKVSLEELQAKVNSGAVITNVAKGENGITVTLSDGKSYELTNGKGGKDATVWTIDENDGFWYKDGVKTSYKAVGVDGNAGEKGKDGEAGGEGKAGENGQYYVPNQTTGCFDIWKDNKFVESTNVSWKIAPDGGITAILDGNVLSLTGVTGKDGNTVSVDLVSGIALSSIAFIPDVVSSDVPYATTSKPFYHIKNYLDETKYNAVDKTFVKQIDWNKSNVVTLNYRLNPEDANVNGSTTVYGFIDRKIATRATGDRKVLLNLDNKATNDGVVAIGATINPIALTSNPEYNIAALQAWYGQKPLTSDYVHVTSSAIDLVLADTVKTVLSDPASEFYPRTKAITDAQAEDDAFVKSVVSLSKSANVEFKYDKNIDLRKYVGLYSNIKTEWLAELGFKGMSYEFSIPKTYLADDNQSTNQQWFITKDGKNEAANGVIKVNPEVTNLTPAIGRTPVVRVDAFLTDNNGARKLVASSYIKLSISRNDPSPSEKPDYGIIKMGDDKFAEYYKLEDSNKAFTNSYEKDDVYMDYQAINNKIYGTSKLTSTTFWNNYGGAHKVYKVSVSVIEKNDKEKVLHDEDVASTDIWQYSQNGLVFSIDLNNNNTQTSAIKVGINNSIKTQNTYKDVDNHGAKYSVKLTIVSNDNSHGDIKLEQVFYVKEETTPYTYNPLYYHATYKSLADGKTYDDCIVVKGQNTSGYWEMSSLLSEHFANKGGQNIFGYYNKVNNVSGLQFKWANGVTGVDPLAAFSTDETVKLTTAMTKRDDVKNMTYTVTLVNGETRKFDYNVVFVNPFVAGATNGISILDGIGENKGDVEPQVLVKDNEGSNIYSYNSSSKALALSDKAKEIYKLTSPNIIGVKYTFVETPAWTELDNNMSNGSKLEVDANGKVLWKNEGASLAKDYNLTVIATVTFKDLSVVTCNIPVKLAKR